MDVVDNPDVVDSPRAASTITLTADDSKSSVSSETVSPDDFDNLHSSIMNLGELGDAKPKSRKRSFGDLEQYETPDAIPKKSKLEQKKAQTAVANEARNSKDIARSRFLQHYRDLFLPLLPPNTGVFNTVGSQLAASGDKCRFIPLHELNEQPKLVKCGQMKDYQLHGLSYLVWMYNNGMNCILGDEMGLGKTLQTLSLFAYIKERTKCKQDPHLVICPLSVLPSWLAEAERWIPSFKTIRFHGTKSDRARLRNEIRSGMRTFDIMIATYDSYVAEEGWFKTRRWTYCVLDEGHKIKNAEAKVASRLQGLGSLYRLILTGTPVQNNLVELWSILHWLYPQVFTRPSERLFKQAFDLSNGDYSIPFLKAAEKLLSTIMLRRTKSAVDISVPPRDELTVFLPMTEAQRFWTYRLLTRMDSMDLKEIFDTKLEDDPLNAGRKEVQVHLAQQVMRGKSGQGDQWKRLMNLLLQLRMACDHPYLLPDAEPEPYAIGEHLVASSSKFIMLDKLLTDILPKGERVLVFSQWTNMLDLVEDFMVLRGFRYARLDGSTSRPRRALDIRLFQQEDSPYQVFLISTRAGGLGINLTKATTVVMLDSDWNPQNDLQAIARAHRIGQTKTVKVYRLVCRGSVEDQMLDRIRRKLFLSLKVIGAENSAGNGENPQLKTGELLTILQKGSSALSTADGIDFAWFLQTPVHEVLEASRERDDVRIAKARKLEGEDDVREELVRGAEDEERSLLAGVARVQSRLFEGRIVDKAGCPSNADIAKEWEEIQKYARYDRVVKVDGLEMIAEHVGPEPSAVPAPAPAVKRKRRKFEHEDYCIHCRDGGELFLCDHCPRVFHARCRGFTKKYMERVPLAICTQHKCTSCQRNTSDAGGMLFRCRTCPQAFCEDCLPQGELGAIGDELPEFLALGYGATASAYYIQCDECRARREEEPEWWAVWQEEFRAAEEKLARSS